MICDPGGLPHPRKAISIAAVLLAMSLVVLDAGMVNVALPTLADALSATPARAVLVVTAYQTALVMALLPCAALGERFGPNRVFRLGIALFLAGAVLCTLAPALPWLIAARFVQGLGGAAVMALGVSLLRFTLPADRLGAAVGWNALTVALSSATAPALGALVVAKSGWPALFVLDLPLGAAALAASAALPRPPVREDRLDPVSMSLNGAAFAMLVLAAQAAPKTPMLALGLAAGTVGAFVLLARREAPKPAPLLPLDLLARRAFRLSVAASIFCFTAQAAALVALPFHLQHTLDMPALSVGLFLLPWPLTVAVSAAVAGRLSDRISTARLCAAGGMVLALGLTGFAVWPIEGDAWPLLVLAAICGAGFGLFQVPNNRNLFMAAPPERSGAAGGMQGTARLTGQVTGALLLGILFTCATAAAAPRLGLAIGAVCALAAAITSLGRDLPGTATATA